MFCALQSIIEIHNRFKGPGLKHSARSKRFNFIDICICWASNSMFCAQQDILVCSWSTSERLLLYAVFLIPDYGSLILSKNKRMSGGTWRCSTKSWLLFYVNTVIFRVLNLSRCKLARTDSLRFCLFDRVCSFAAALLSVACWVKSQTVRKSCPLSSQKCARMFNLNQCRNSRACVTLVKPPATERGKCCCFASTIWRGHRTRMSSESDEPTRFGDIFRLHWRFFASVWEVTLFVWRH